ncbi:MAG TPA: pentapeptide repeat-containing protein [Leptolyngbya sp.]|nr:pentapeptide repeat-containing protein [Leptolyngbya sp.]
MSELERCYQLLGLEPGASFEEVNQAYKDLVFVWHPDRVPKDNPRLLQKAETKIKEFNHARDILRSHYKNGAAPKPAAQPQPSSQQTYYQSYYYRPPTSPGHSTNGRQGNSSNGHSSNGHSSNGHSEKQSNPHPRYQSYQPYPRPNHSQSSGSDPARSTDANRKSEPPKPADSSQNYYRQSHYRAEYHQPPKTPSRPQTHDMTGKDLSGQNLKEKDLSGYNLSRANLTRADLSDTFMHKVNLEGAKLEKANLFRANLLEANLCGADLREANLIGADLSGADLRGADLRGAKVGFDDRIMVKLTGANLQGAIMPNGKIHGVQN